MFRKCVMVFGLMMATMLNAQTMSEDDAFAIYQKKSGSKAFASNGQGAWGVTFGAHILSDALQKSLAACEKNRTDGSRACQIIAEDASVGTYARQGLAMSPSAQQEYDVYLNTQTGGHKAFAVSSDGPWGSAYAGSIQVAKSNALADCNALGENLSPCFVVDVDGFRQRYGGLKYNIPKPVST